VENRRGRGGGGKKGGGGGGGGTTTTKVLGFRNITICALSVAELEGMNERKMELHLKKAGCHIKHFGKI